MTKKPRFRTPFDSKHAKRSEILLISARQQLRHFFQSLRGKWSTKISLLVISKILEAFVNTLTAYDKYPFCNSENLWQPIQMQLSKKEKTFPEFFAPFPKSTSNFEHFEKGDNSHSS